MAMTAISLSMAASGFAQSESSVQVSRNGTQASFKGPAQSFTGAVRVDPLFQTRPTTHATGAYVTFEPGARTAWHTHPAGQTLVVTAGSGHVQRWGDAVHDIRPGDVVWIPPGQKHWHGASATTAMTHMAITEPVDGKSVNWLEKVSDAQYGVRP
ncbi:cupin domain-containing protein [Variovorax dokdonensis]|uniref:Cupin domain-containing protein n=1 Tax=Variovorax dokdonensis TaxID=344883 RepID=A0ABT7ND82_9BURK|nr:cupin domain-containing protein [Variovorax dokdonensis]MDM0045876.1 cupin domain-containing protein [Variovorax dokdonensis]